MNLEALQKVRDRLQLISVRPVQIHLDVNTKAFPFHSLVSIPCFTRFQWTCIEQNNTVFTPSDGVGPIQNAVTLVVKAITEIAVMYDNQPLPENVPIPEDRSIAKVDINLAVDYVTDLAPEALDPEGMLEFIQYNAPYHFWPYWRELIQNLALRAQLPLPMLPTYKVPEAARPTQPKGSNNE